MHFLRSKKLHHAIAFCVGAGIGVLYFMSAIAANADTVAGVSIAANGQTIVRGARVTHVSKDEIIAVSEWGKATMQWKIEVSGTTKFAPARVGQLLTDLVRVGETIGFSGLMDERTAVPTLYASMIRNETVMQSASVLDGSVVGTEGGRVLVATETGTSTILIGTGTIMTKDGNHADISDLNPGETVKAFGTFNARERELQAERVLLRSLPEIPNTGSATKRSVFDSIVAWFRSKSSTLSVR